MCHTHPHLHPYPNPRTNSCLGCQKETGKFPIRVRCIGNSLQHNKTRRPLYRRYHMHRNCWYRYWANSNHRHKLSCIPGSNYRPRIDTSDMSSRRSHNFANRSKGQCKRYLRDCMDQGKDYCQSRNYTLGIDHNCSSYPVPSKCSRSYRSCLCRYSRRRKSFRKQWNFRDNTDLNSEVSS